MANIENATLDLYDHQKEAYKKVEELFDKERYAAVVFPTGCGKSFVTLKYILEHPDQQILFLSPRKAIKEQMYEYVVRFIGGVQDSIEEIQAQYGSMEKCAQTFIPGLKCMLYQTVLGIGENERLERWLEKHNYDTIVVDEMHHLKTRKQNESRDVVIDEEELLTEQEKSERKAQQNEWGRKFKELLSRYPNAKVLGLSATPVRNDGANVVERLFGNSVASEISLLEAMEEGIIIPPRYITPDFLEQDELETLLQQIEKAEGEKKEELKAKYNELVEQSSHAKGIPELLDEHITERDGKYIIFCKDIKDMEEKQKLAGEWFGKIDAEPEIYRVSSKHDDSQQQLDEFNVSDSDHIKLLYCVGMIDEGVHLKGVSGVILTAKTGSRPTYLQRLGRAISSGKDKKQALVIDLVNNNEILFDERQQSPEYGYEITDIESLQKLIDWIDEKNAGKLPENIEGKSTRERAMARRIARINNKYFKYIEIPELIESITDLHERQEIENIIALGEEIGLWDRYIVIEQNENPSIDDYVNNFLRGVEIKGNREDFKKLLEGASNPTKESMASELLRCLKILNNSGDIQARDIRMSKRITINGTSSKKKTTIDMLGLSDKTKRRLQKSGFNGDYQIGAKIESVKKRARGYKREGRLTQEEQIAFLKLGIITKDDIEFAQKDIKRESMASEFIKCLMILEASGDIDVATIKRSKLKKEKNGSTSTTIDDLDISEETRVNLEKAGFNGGYKIGDKIQHIKRIFRGKKGMGKISPEEQQLFIELGILNSEDIKLANGELQKNSMIAKLLRCLQILKESEDIDVSTIPKSKSAVIDGMKKQVTTTLEDLSISEDTKEILIESDFNMDYPIGRNIGTVINIARSGKKTTRKLLPEEQQLFIELGIITEEDIKLANGDIQKESTQAELLRCLMILKENEDIDASAIPRSKMVIINGQKKQQRTTLEDLLISKETKEILKKSNFNMDYPIGMRIEQIIQIARGQRRGNISPEEQQLFIELGIITEEDIKVASDDIQKESMSVELLRCLNIIKSNEVIDLGQIKLRKSIVGRKNPVSTTIEDLNLKSETIKMLIDAGIDSSYGIGTKIKTIRNVVRGTGKGLVTPEQEQAFLKLGIITEDDIEKGKNKTNNKGKLQQAKARKNSASNKRDVAQTLKKQVADELAKKKGKTHDE